MTLSEGGRDVRDGVGVVEGAGWATLAILTLAVVLLAVFRPVSAGQLYNQIRLAAGFDRYQAAMNEGDRLFALGRAELRLAGDDRERRLTVYRHFEESAASFAAARRMAEGFYEEQQAQNRMADAYLAWAHGLYTDGTGPWYRINHRPTLRRAREIVDEALALPSIEGGRRAHLEELGEEIDRAITPWPIL